MESTENLPKLVKPSLQTPPSLHNYKISFIDELAPSVYVPLILYYPPPPYNNIKPQHPNFPGIPNQLELSLSETLTHFYPFAGRLKREDASVDCSDQGVEYVQGKANFQLAEILGLPAGDLKPDALNDFLPRNICKAVEDDDPILSIKVTTFECGSLTIAICVQHKIADMSTICTFINHWASTNRKEKTTVMDLQLFTAAQNFPCRGLPELSVEKGLKNATRRFLFKGKAIAALREKIGSVSNGRRTPSKVQLVVALLWKALVRIDQEKNGQSKASLLAQPVNLRDKVVPPLPENSFGNIWALAASRLGPGEGDSIDFAGYFELLRNSIKKTATHCAKLLRGGEDSYKILVNPLLEQLGATKADGDNVNIYLFTSWCNFSYYQADFGWGKPVWASPAKRSLINYLCAMDDQEGDGVEAWVFLDEERMAKFEQDSEVKAYTNY